MKRLMPWIFFVACVGILSMIKPAASDPGSITGPLKVSTENPRYFADRSGRTVYLTGSHTWSNLQDNGAAEPLPLFDYSRYLDFLTANNHNFFRLWTWEQAKWTNERVEDYQVGQLPFQRTGPGMALDGKPKFDLTRFNQAYFDRIRSRVVAAGRRGIYVSIMFFNGWSVEKAKGTFNLNNPWKGHPFNRNNNINGIDGDLNHDDSGAEVHTLLIPVVRRVQERYVRKVIDMVNDLDNVLYEISNESHSGSEEWQYAMIRYIKTYEKLKPKQHPVGMTVEWPGGDNAKLFASPADWISPTGDMNNPTPGDGRKVILYDTDHLCGICGDTAWVWRSFLMGLNPILMDIYDGAALGLGASGYKPEDPKWAAIRRNMGYARKYAMKVNLSAMSPRPDLASTGYCLANPHSSKAAYLVYLPVGGTLTSILRFLHIHKTILTSLPFDSTVTVDLSGSTGDLLLEWFNPATGETFSGETTNGGSKRSFTSPFRGEAVLYIHSVTTHSVGAVNWT